MSATAPLNNVVPLTKRCPVCATVKSATEFWVTRSRRDGLAGYCKPCDKKIRVARQKDPTFSFRCERKPRLSRSQVAWRAWLRREYNLTVEDAHRLLEQQFGLCANRACGKELSFLVAGNAPNRAVIDHCHRTGVVRGVLCHYCNRSAGALEKHRNLFLGLTEYLDRSLK